MAIANVDFNCHSNSPSLSAPCGEKMTYFDIETELYFLGNSDGYRGRANPKFWRHPKYSAGFRDGLQVRMQRTAA